ncbi:MAG: hypothetical protein COB07_02085 [Sulfurovum sp.]|nr:MAG: hypothetical protein COB07_02085 [Sulfurovum sp.]
MFAGCNSTTQESNDNVNTVVVEDVPETEETTAISVRPEIETPLVEEEEHDSKPLVEEEFKPANWYIRLVAEAPSRALKTNSAQFGILEKSDAAAKHTLISSGRFSGPYLDVVFIDPDGRTADVYKSDYHTYQEGTEERWMFTVGTDDSTSEVSLTWNGMYLLTPYIDSENREQYKESLSLNNPLITYMKLVDVETGKEIAVSVDGQAQTYIFNMNGQNERVFEWVVQTEVVSIPLTKSSALTSKAKSIQKNVAIMNAKIEAKRAESFDLSKPPIFKEARDGK